MAFQFQKHETLHKRQNTQQPHYSKRIIQFKAKYSAVFYAFHIIFKRCHFIPTCLRKNRYNQLKIRFNFI